jgi:hypothetical protein
MVFVVFQADKLGRIQVWPRGFNLFGALDAVIACKRHTTPGVLEWQWFPVNRFTNKGLEFVQIGEFFYDIQAPTCRLCVYYTIPSALLRTRVPTK